MFYRTCLQESNEIGCDNYEESQVTFHLHTEFYQISSFKVNFNVIAQYVENCVMGSVVIIIIIITAIEFSVAIVLTLVQGKQIRINIHKRNSTKTQYK